MTEIISKLLLTRNNTFKSRAAVISQHNFFKIFASKNLSIIDKKLFISIVIKSKFDKNSFFGKHPISCKAIGNEKSETKNCKS